MFSIIVFFFGLKGILFFWRRLGLVVRFFLVIDGGGEKGSVLFREVGCVRFVWGLVSVVLRGVWKVFLGFLFRFYGIRLRTRF